MPMPQFIESCPNPSADPCALIQPYLHSPASSNYTALCASCSAVYCNRSCLFVCVGWVCYQDNSNLRASILTKLGLLVKVVTISSWLNFGRPVPPGRYEAGWKFLAPPYYSQRTVFASPLSAFFIINFIRGHVFRTVYGLMLINWRERKHCRPINSAGFCTWSVSLPKPAGFLQLYTQPREVQVLHGPWPAAALAFKHSPMY